MRNGASYVGMPGEVLPMADGLRAPMRRIKARLPPPVPPVPGRLAGTGVGGALLSGHTDHLDGLRNEPACIRGFAKTESRAQSPSGCLRLVEKGNGSRFQEVLARQLDALQERLSQAHVTALHDLEVENRSLRAENRDLRKKLQFQVDDGHEGGTRHSLTKASPHAEAKLAVPSAVDSHSENEEKEDAPTVKLAMPSVEAQKGEACTGVAHHRAGQLPRGCRGPWPVWSHLKGGTLVNEMVTELSARVSVRESLVVAQGGVEELEAHGDRWVFHPTSGYIMFWTALTPLLLLYDTIMIPLTGGFELPRYIGFYVMDIIVATYWALDIARICNTGYETSSTLGVEMQRWKIFKQYGKTWLVVDVGLVCMDWVLTLETGSTGNTSPARARRAARIWRVIRMARLVRVVKFARRLWSRLLHKTMTLKQLLALKACYVILADVFICHYMACYFSALVSEADIFNVLSGSDLGWKVVNFGQEELDIGNLYAIALNWALAQSGFATTSIKTTNKWERLYSTFVGAFWLLNVSVTISLFTSWLAEVREANHEMNKESIRLRKFIEHHDLPRKLCHRILRYFAESQRAVRVIKTDVPFLRNLPLKLQIILCKEVYVPILHQHSFFQLLGNESQPALFTVCQLAVSDFRYNPAETVFVEGNVAQHVFCVLHGELDYYNDSAFAATRLMPGDWCCEPALWNEWVHPGRLVAATTCELMGIAVNKVHAIIEEAVKLGEEFEAVSRMASRSISWFADVATGQSDLAVGPDSTTMPRHRPRSKAFALRRTCWETLTS